MIWAATSTTSVPTWTKMDEAELLTTGVTLERGEVEGVADDVVNGVDPAEEVGSETVRGGPEGKSAASERGKAVSGFYITYSQKVGVRHTGRRRQRDQLVDAGRHLPLHAIRPVRQIVSMFAY
jgi:hypothetical protein